MYKIISKKEYDKIYLSKINKYEKLKLISEICRFNTITAVKKAGSGHLGSSFSAMDIIVYLYHKLINILDVGLDSPNRDIYFSSKGHDVPGLYSLFYLLGIIPLDKLLLLRRIDGLDGHPEKHIPGIEANSGSLGMGISKARGMAWAKKYNQNKGNVYVMVGDGELQEGQNFEALQSTISQEITNLTVIVDHNKYQTDDKIENVVSLGNLKEKLESFGWYVHQFDGHNYNEIEKAFKLSSECNNLPKILIANTIKGKGVSFMEPGKNKGYYNWHSGAPDDKSFELAINELTSSLNERCLVNKISNIKYLNISDNFKKNDKSISSEYVADGYGEELVELARERKEIIVLDGDLSADCRIRGFEKEFPDRFIENGIAEQDMVSMAGGLASQGLLPIVNSFASFLSSRPNEQIYNNTCENTKIIYACHFAGIIPAGPGKSHQSIRDISLFSSLGNVTIFQPSSSEEAKLGLKYFVDIESGACVLRMNIGPSPRIISLPNDYSLQKGKGFSINEGRDIVIVSYGPVMLNEAITAASILSNIDVQAKVINMPWLNYIDFEWLNNEIGECTIIYVIDDHSEIGGLGDYLISQITNLSVKIVKLGLKSLPKCGSPLEVLKAHKLDGKSIAKLISVELNKSIDDFNDNNNIQYTNEAPQ
ncbi:MAG: 1-deoxy-D-xylulose-5-phosphate synthase [Candidatus Marinimicrobia bacterium]|nr:1-deoxy-D-xylulose-5-phosphate synthase [Candidatus Neomarinimicrobiota bacterium]|tara:strand:+ start:15709 stop:17661 length:1953 start_codon:yes stop_codon:yes gene_type:complete